VVCAGTGAEIVLELPSVGWFASSLEGSRMFDKTKQSDSPRHVIISGAVLAVVGVVVFYFIVEFDIPTVGPGNSFLFLTPLGIGVVFYGLFLAWRGRSRKR
jgi:hypothetical protein